MTLLGQFIGGSHDAGTGAATVLVTNPADGSVVLELGEAGVADVHRATEAAALAQPGWAGLAPGERSAVLLALADRIEARAEEYAQTETAQTGKPIKLSREFDVPGSIDNVRFFAAGARMLTGLAQAEYDSDHTSSIRREPVGVIGAIAPWNYPLQMAMWKVLPAVAAGNAIVLKPSELTPLTSLMLAEDAVAAGLPPGVLNVLTGSGSVVGEALVTDPRVAMVSFTGSTAVGRRVMELAAGTVKQVHLELGGKAPFVVFDDADLEAAAQGAVAGCLINTGQDCTAATRAYVARPRLDAFVARVAELFAQVRLGDPRDPATDQGPLISAAQRAKVHGYVQRAAHAGARIVTGGELPGAALDGGWYYPPTLITDVAQDAEIVCDELFGPVLVVLPFDTDDEGIALANDTRYGLAASAWTTSTFRAQRASRELQAGCVWINDHIPIVSEMPHGGFKQSGFGKDMSLYSLEEYTRIKHVSAEITGVARKDWHRTVFGDRT